MSNKFSVYRNEHYSEKAYRENCQKLIGIPFDISTKLHGLEQLNGEISSLHCISALRKVLYDTLNIHLVPSYIRYLPNILKEQYNYNKVSVDEIQNGDIVFLRKISRDSISHVVLGLDKKEIFHACRSRNTIIELWDCLNGEYSTEY